MRTFKLTDDCTLSGQRLHPDERKVEGGADLEAPLARKCRWNVGGGGGYLDPAGGLLIIAHSSVDVPPEGMNKACPERRRGREKLVPLAYNRSS